MKTITKIPLYLWIIISMNLALAATTLYLQLDARKPTVYIDQLKLMANYQGIKDMKAKLDLRAKEWQGNLDTLSSELQLAAKKLESIPVSSSAQRQLAEASLRSKQQEAMQYKEAVTQKYKEQDQLLSQELLTKVNAYIKEYGERKGYKIIMAATQYGNIAYGDKSVDITDDVLEGLNTEYNLKK